MKITLGQLKQIITRALVPINVNDIEQTNACNLGSTAGRAERSCPSSEVEPPTVEDAFHPSEVVPREDAWSGGDNIEDPLDHARFETGESNAGHHVVIQRKYRR